MKSVIISLCIVVLLSIVGSSLAQEEYNPFYPLPNLPHDWLLPKLPFQDVYDDDGVLEPVFYYPENGDFDNLHGPNEVINIIDQGYLYYNSANQVQISTLLLSVVALVNMIL